MRFLDPLADPQWDERLLAHEDASVFHTAGWARVLKDSYGYTNDYLVETEGDRMLFLLPLMEVRSLLTGKRAVSLPFTDFCDPLLAGEAPGETSGETVLAALVARGRERGWRYFELRGGGRLLGGHQPATTVLEHELDLAPSEEALFAGLKESTRRNIRKAGREGVEVEIGTSAEMVESFYRLNCLTRREHGLPPQPISFFRNLHESTLARGQGRVVLATVRGQVAGGALYLHFGRNALYKYGASDPRFLALRPNDLVMWEAIRWYRSGGFRTLSLGRTEHHHEGLRRYKIAWGVKEQEKPYYRYDFAAAGFVRARAAEAGVSATVFRHLPVGISRLIGSALYRHVA